MAQMGTDKKSAGRGRPAQHAGRVCSPNQEPKFLRTAVLTMLDQAGAYALPEAVVAKQAARGGFSQGVPEALAWLHQKGFADYELDHLTDEKRWRITTAGKGQLA